MILKKAWIIKLHEEILFNTSILLNYLNLYLSMYALWCNLKEFQKIVLK